MKINLLKSVRDFFANTRINPWPLAFVRITNEDLGGFAGTSRGASVKILEKYKDDAGLLVHELTHVKVYWVVTLSFIALICLIDQLYLLPLAPFLNGWGYDHIKFLRLHEEIFCYRAQMAEYDDDIDRSDIFAGFVAGKKYNLDITKEEAKALLLK